MYKTRFGILVSVFIFFCSCGYSLQGSESILPDDIKQIAIPIVENNTTMPGLGIQFTQLLRARFDRYGVVKVIDKVDQADATLHAKIVDVQTRTQNVTSSTDISVQQEMVLVISAELKRKNGQILWKDPLLTITESFADVSDVVVTSSTDFAQSGINAGTLGTLSSREVSRGQQEQALDGLLEEAARKIYLSAVAADF